MKVCNVCKSKKVDFSYEIFDATKCLGRAGDLCLKHGNELIEHVDKGEKENEEVS